MDIAAALQSAGDIFRKAGIAESRREAASLLTFILQKDPIFIVAHPDYCLSETEVADYAGVITRRATHEPFHHITGRKEFYGLDFFVSRDVLIPRPETELLVEAAIDVLKRIVAPRFCEIGTGSGCISVSVLHELPSATGFAVDVSEAALMFARRNAKANGVLDRIEFEISDVFYAFGEEIFDAILSNPPYIPAANIAALQTEVRDFDPRISLTDGGDGLSIIQRIISESPKFLRSGGFLLLEIGHDQADAVRKMFDTAIWQSVDILPDLQGIPRTVKVQINH